VAFKEKEKKQQPMISSKNVLRILASATIKVHVKIRGRSQIKSSDFGLMTADF